MTDEAFDQLVLRFFDHELSDREFAALQASLAESAEARRRYLQLAELNGLLAAVAAQPMPRRVEPPLRKPLASRKTPASRQRPKRRLVPVLAAAAAIAVAALALHEIWKRAHQPLVTFRAAPGSLWETTDADATSAAGKPSANTLGIGSRLKLRQGVVELDFASGVKAFVSGPADLTLDSNNLLRMNEGRGRFTVPPKALGFKVVSNDLDVIDLGTEFGVVTFPLSRGAEVHVFKGKVKAVPPTGSGEVVTAGMARFAQRGSTSLREISLAPSLFPTSLANSLANTHAAVSQAAFTVVPLTGNANSSPFTEDGFTTANNHVGVTLNDRFSYDPNTYSPTVGTQPTRGNADGRGYQGVGFHGNDGPGTPGCQFLRYTFSSLTTLDNGALFVVDLWGRNHEPAYPRQEFFTINLYHGAFGGEPVATLTSGIPASATTQYGRTTFVLPKGVTFDRVEITSDTDYFSIAETRAAFKAAP